MGHAMKDAGEILDPMHMMMLKKCGACQGPNGTYELYIDQSGQPYIQSDLTKRKFRLLWQSIVEMAVDNGIDDRVIRDESKPKHYHMECESGRFSDAGFQSLPFGTKQ